MRLYSDKEVVKEAEFFLDNNIGVIRTAKLLNMPKSTLHWHLNTRLKKIDYRLWMYAKATLVKRRSSK